MTKEFKRNLLRNILLPRVYKRAAKKPINPKKVVFANNRHVELPDNMRELEKLFIENGYEICYHLKKKYSKKAFIRRFERYSEFKRFMRNYATASFVFLTDYYMPAYTAQPREGTRMVQLWHACGAFKRWGYSSTDKPWGLNPKVLEKYPVHNTYTDVFCSSPEIIPSYAEAFNCSPDIIVPLGAPRTDIYFDEEFVQSSRAFVEEKCPGIEGRKILLYAPTFRGNSVRKAHNKLNLDIARFYENFSDEYVLLLKLHPFVANKFKLKKSIKDACPDFVYNVSKSVPIDRALCSADLLISDYSSVIFEYSLLNRPMVFFAYDKDKYIKDRDFYYPYDEFVPGPIAENNDELIEYVKLADKSKVEDFCKKFMSGCDGNCTQRIFDYLTGGSK